MSLRIIFSPYGYPVIQPKLHFCLKLCGIILSRLMQLMFVTHSVYEKTSKIGGLKLLCDKHLAGLASLLFLGIISGGIEMMFFGSHCHGLEGGNVLKFYYEFDKGWITYTEEAGKTTFEGHLKDGTIVSYNKPQMDSYQKLCRFIEQVQEGRADYCSAEAAYSHTLCINGFQESMPEITEFPAELIKSGILPTGDEALYVEGLKNILLECYEQWSLLGEMGIAWARTGRKINLTDYTQFPQISKGSEAV